MAQKIILTKDIGFCFGVNRAIKIAEDLATKGEKVCTLGELIHNKEVLNSLEKKGIKNINKIEELSPSEILVIRAHGVPETTIEEIKRLKINFVDATCPFVKKIHDIVKNIKNKNAGLLVAGDKDHPEVKGIVGHTKVKTFIFDDKESIDRLIKEQVFKNTERIIVVSQTTFSTKRWEDCISLLKRSFDNLEVYNTICNTTEVRQKQAEELSKKVDLMLVIGDKKSSNTNKLYDICKKNTKTMLINNLKTIKDNYEHLIKEYKTIGVTAGASTPEDLVNRILNILRLGNEL